MFPFGTDGSLHFTSTLSGATSLAVTSRGEDGAKYINSIEGDHHVASSPGHSHVFNVIRRKTGGPGTRLHVIKNKMIKK